MVKSTITQEFMRYLKCLFCLFIFINSISVNAATYVVDSNADTDNLLSYTLSDGTNTLRKCIRLANANLGLDAIQFNLSGSTIITNTTGALAWFDVTDPVAIDGITGQPGASAGNPVIELNGNGVGSTYCIRINTAASGSILKGLIIYGTNTGVRFESSMNNVVAGCWIGVDNTGNAAAPTTINSHGIHGFTSSNNIIGGSGGLADRNIIGFCSGDGIRFEGGTSSSNVVRGNYIGIGADGSTDTGNNGHGVFCTNGEFFTVGGTGATEGNVISSNNSHAVSIFGSASREATIQGNIIGLTADGLTARFNFLHGIDLNENEDSQIGGIDPNARNIIANSGWSGISLVNSPGTIVENNYIGTDITGLVDMGNFNHGIIIVNSADITIGGTTSASRNVISGNFQRGISLEQVSPNAIIKANYIGVGSDGSTLIKNDIDGIASYQASHNMIIGGPTLAEGNVISGNGLFTVEVDDLDNGIVGDGISIQATNNHLIQNNYIGTDATGLIGYGNHWAGISLNYSSGNQILDNIVSDNRNEGIWINGSANNVFYRNIIGEASDGSPLGNWDYGLYLVNFNPSFGTNSNIFGGSAVNANTIAHTRGERPTADGDGVTIESSAGDFNEFTYNNIHCNEGKGIIRAGSSNESQAAPTISASGANAVSGTGDNGRIVHIYRNVSTGGTGCDCEGESFIGSTTIVGGTWSFTHNLGLSAGDADKVVATQTTVGGSTSEIAVCLAPPLPVELIYFEGKMIDEHSAELLWSTASETNNDRFHIERSRSANDWTEIGTVFGAGNSSDIINYSFIDHHADLNSGGWYYRLRQVDFDGTYEYSSIIYIENTTGELTFDLYPNPSSDEINIRGIDSTLYGIGIADSSGKNVTSHVNISTQSTFLNVIDISKLDAGTYILRVGPLAKKFVKF